MPSEFDPLHPDSGGGTRTFLDPAFDSHADTRPKPPTGFGSSLDSTPTPFIPDLPRYKASESLGHGGMGHVLLAYDTVLKRQVALKFMLRPGEATDAARTRFAAESAVLAQLNHPNVVKVFDAGEANGLLYFSMAYLPGGSLSKRREEFRTSALAAVEVVEGVACGVHHAHENGIFHRDLKSGNVLLDGRTPVVTDFGCAKWDEAEMSTEGFALFGTPSHMAPEVVVRGSKDFDARGDVWSIGVILYQLLAGELPFPEDPRFEPGRLALLNIEPKPLADGEKVVPGVDDRLERVVRKALAKNPDDRYQTVADFAADLAAWRTGGVLQAPVVPPKRRRRRRWAWAAVAGAVLVVGVLAVVFWPKRVDVPEVKPTIAELLRRGETVTLVDGEGNLLWPLTKVAGFAGGIETAQAERALSLSSGGVLLATFDTTGLEPPFTLRADVHHAVENEWSELGIGVAHRRHEGGEHSLYTNSFRGQSHPPGEMRPHPAEAFAGGRWIDLRHPEFPLHDLGRTLPRCGIDPHPAGTPREYRRLTVTVTADRVTAEHAGVMIDTVTWRKLNTRAESKFVTEKEPIPVAVFGDGVGLFVRTGDGLFRNVVIEPNR